jgi:type IV pilus assembly protein PilP
MSLPILRRSILLAAACAGLGGCGDGGVQEIKTWMDGVRRDTKVFTPKLAEPKKFIPYTYAGKDSVDPFNPAKLAAAFARMRPATDNALKPDLDRRREPLESYPLDSVKMVGTLQKPG